MQNGLGAGGMCGKENPVSKKANILTVLQYDYVMSLKQGGSDQVKTVVYCVPICVFIRGGGCTSRLVLIL